MMKVKIVIGIIILILVGVGIVMANNDDKLSNEKEIHIKPGYNAIQNAVDKANNDTTIFLGNGTYNEYTISVNKSITIKSEENAEVTVNANGQGNVFVIDNEKATLSGLTITGGEAVDAGGVRNLKGTVTNCIIKNNTADGVWGCGGIHNYFGIVENCTVENNRAEKGNSGGVYNYYGLVINSIVKNNNASGKGGGICNIQGIVENCKIENNKAYEGGGIFNSNGTIVNSIVVSKTETGSSGIFSEVDGGSICNKNGTVINSTGTVTDYVEDDEENIYYYTEEVEHKPSFSDKLGDYLMMSAILGKKK